MNIPKINPKLQFNLDKVEEEMKKGYRFEADPMGPFYRLRFFNEVDSVMLLANREQARQIHAELGRALGLGKDRAKRRRAAKKP